MTNQEIDERIARIKSESSNDERAHEMEKDLWEEVLVLVASGVPGCDAKYLAEKALKTRDLEFSRWFA